MSEYNSGFLNTLFEQDPIISPGPETFYIKENLLGGISLEAGNGNTLFETMPNAAGGETLMFDNGETAHVSENIYGGTTVDFAGVSNDIVGMPSIFGGESLYQDGEYVGSIEPNFMGDGVDFTSSTGQTMFSTSPDILGGTEVSFTSPLLESTSSLQTFDLQNSFSEIEAVSSQISVADLGTATDAVDGLDFLDLL
jgi:hypothetical protein